VDAALAWVPSGSTRTVCDVPNASNASMTKAGREGLTGNAVPLDRAPMSGAKADIRMSVIDTDLEEVAFVVLGDAFPLQPLSLHGQIAADCLGGYIATDRHAIRVPGRHVGSTQDLLALNEGLAATLHTGRRTPGNADTVTTRLPRINIAVSVRAANLASLDGIKVVDHRKTAAG
jgi:hypothetical protein